MRPETANGGRKCVPFLFLYANEYRERNLDCCQICGCNCNLGRRVDGARMGCAPNIQIRIRYGYGTTGQLAVILDRYRLVVGAVLRIKKIGNIFTVF